MAVLAPLKDHYKSGKLLTFCLYHSFLESFIKKCVENMLCTSSRAGAYGDQDERRESASGAESAVGRQRIINLTFR